MSTYPRQSLCPMCVLLDPHVRILFVYFSYSVCYEQTTCSFCTFFFNKITTTFTATSAANDLCFCNNGEAFCIFYGTAWLVTFPVIYIHAFACIRYV